MLNRLSENFVGRLLISLPILLVLFDQALISGSRLVSQVVVARYGAAELPGIGFYVSTFGFVVLFLTLIESFVTTPINVFLPQQPEQEQGAFFASALRFTLSLVALGACVCLAVSWALGSTLMTPKLIAITLAWFLPAQLLREFARRWLLATENIAFLVRWNVIASLILFLCLGVSIAFDRADAIVVFGWVSISNLCFLAAWWWQFHMCFDFSAARNTFFLNAGWRYGRWVAGEGICGVLVLFFSQWYISVKLDESAADLYGACLTLVFIANPFLLGVTSYYSPRAARLFHASGWGQLKKSLWRFTLFVAVVLGAITLAFYFCGGWLLSTVFGPEFAGGARSATILSLGMVFLGLTYMVATTLQTVGLPQINLYSSLLAAIFVVAYSFLFIHNQIESAAWGFLGSSIVSLVSRTLGLFAFRSSYNAQPMAPSASNTA